MEPRPEETETAPIQMAFLGPPGTYGEQAAQAFASAYHYPIDLVPCSTITDVYNHSAPLIALPLENTLQGSVLETLDSMLSVLNSTSVASPSDRTPQRSIIKDLVLPIRHCLVGLKGTIMSHIAFVRSHEQALGQSAHFLRKYLPNAKLEKWSSTAGAAVSLLQKDSEQTGAAICSKAVVSLYPNELEVLCEGTQYGTENYTRFLLLAADSWLPSPHIIQPTNGSAEYSAFYAISSPSLSPFLSTTSWRMKTIHSRPAAEGISYANDKFPKWYLVETLEMGAGRQMETQYGEESNEVLVLGRVRQEVENKYL
ncbi:hypothetical protein L204_105285 [Cryptococcus depauperatus]|nr:hypothetical protein L204_06326 [Cryptococcus depauperatus CBS 7855]